MPLSTASLVIALAIVASPPPAAAAAQAQTTDSTVEVVLSGPPGLHRCLQRLGHSGHDVELGYSGAFETARLYASQSAVPQLRSALPGIILRVLRRGQPYRNRIATARAAAQAAGIDMPAPDYRTPAEVIAALQALESAHPTRAKLYDLQSRTGAPATHDGRQIYVLRISDNPQLDEDEPNLLLFANNHARELNSIEAPIDAAERILNGYGTDPTLTQLVDDNQVWILPNMNPDGLDHVWNNDDFWRKNRRDNGDGSFGVDLNRNYGFDWGRCGSSSRTTSSSYRGPASESEPETQAMLAFARAEGLERVLDIHSFSRDVRLPFNPEVIDGVPSFFRDAYTPIHQDVSGQMNYRTRTTCCCGTHMEWHHARNGSLGMLIEMGDAFQPAYADTQTELVRMWPGVRAFLTAPAPLRGHVRSMDGGVPLEAEITVEGAAFVDGQRIRAQGRFGRYTVWGGFGTTRITATAPGHEPKTVEATLIAGQTATLDIELEPTMAATTLTAVGTGVIGSAVSLRLSSPDDPGRSYFVIPGLAAEPEITVGCRSIPVAASGLIEAAASTPALFADFFSTLDASGAASPTFLVPPLPFLVGIEFRFAAITIDPTFPRAVKGISNGVSVVVQAQ